MNKDLKEYDASQREAICHGLGPALVLAGPGSGKTTVLTKRLQYLITTYHIPPQEILVVTFTKAAAIEMQQRFYKLMGARLPVCFGTFHSIFYRILKENNSKQHSLTILTEKEKRNLVQSILKKEGIEESYVPIFLEKFAHIKNGRKSKLLLEGLPERLTEMQFFNIFEFYRQKCSQNGKLDFDDMAYECLWLFRKRPDLLKCWQKRFRYILADEYQDIAPIQEKILFMLALPENNLFLVGDDDQAIYGFRGAGTESMLSFPQKYTDTKQIFLEMNYRCRPEIVEAAGRMIKENKKRFMKFQKAARGYDTERADNNISGQTNAVICEGFVDRKEEYEKILCKLERAKQEGGLEKCAVLYRKNKDAGLLIKMLEQHKIPYVCTGIRAEGIKEHSVTEDITAYLRFLYGDRTRRNFYLIMNRPDRKIDREGCTSEIINLDMLCQWHRDDAEIVKNIKRLEEGCKRVAAMSLYAAIMYIRKGLGYENWLYENDKKEMRDESLYVLTKLQEAARNLHNIKEWERWLLEREMGRDSEDVDRENKGTKSGVNILTYHGCKGLEFDNVFMPDLNEGIVPHKKAVSEEEIEEERRMFYVGMTRAREKLNLYYIAGTKKEPEIMSRFLKCLINKQ